MSVNAPATDRAELLGTLNDIPPAVVGVRWESGKCAVGTCASPLVAVFVTSRADAGPEESRIGRAFPLCMHHLRRVAV